MDTPITLQSINLKSWEQLYELEPTEILHRMSEHNVPVHPGDAFLAVLVVRAVADLAEASTRLDRWARFYRFAGFALATVATAVAVIHAVS